MAASCTKWRVVDTRERGEIWIFDADDSGPLIWGVHRGEGEPLNVGRGTSVYGLPKDVLATYLDTVIRPALDGGAWNLNDVFEVLELYLRMPDDIAPLLALLSGRLHLAGQTRELTERLSTLFIRYLRQLPLRTQPQERIALLGWCYQLTNAFFVAIREVNATFGWASANRQYLNETFADGLKLLMTAAPLILRPEQAQRFRGQVELFMALVDSMSPA